MLSTPDTSKSYDHIKGRGLTHNVTSETARNSSSSNSDSDREQEQLLMSPSYSTLLDEARTRELHRRLCPVTEILRNVSTDYRITSRVLGKGHHGIVHECEHRRTGRVLACKSINKSKIRRLDHVQREIHLLSRMTHRGIMKMVDCYEDRDYVHIITERCTGGELFDRIAENTSPSGCFSEVNASRIIKSLLEAVGYLHENDIVHRDIKPENVLFRSSHGDSIKLIDFGLARMHKPGDRPMSNPVGTAYYMSPELLKGEYDKSCDIWSIGIIAYILLCGYPPFNGDTDDEIFESIESGQLEYPNKQAWLDKSDTAKDFIKCLLTRDASRRPTAEEASMHPWIVKAAHPKRTTAKDVDFSTRIQNLRCSVHRLNIWSAAA